jgi:hypothetical protein
MIGTPQAPGIMVLTMNDLFEAIRKNENEKQYKITISYLEVYNEQIRDLLVESTVHHFISDYNIALNTIYLSLFLYIYIYTHTLIPSFSVYI